MAQSMSASAPASDSPPAEGLERNAVGLTEVLFQSITHMAPAAAVAYSRVRTRAHWPTDVAVGVAEGVFVGEVVHRAMTRNRP